MQAPQVLVDATYRRSFATLARHTVGSWQSSLQIASSSDSAGWRDSERLSISVSRSSRGTLTRVFLRAGLTPKTFAGLSPSRPDPLGADPSLAILLNAERTATGRFRVAIANCSDACRANASRCSFGRVLHARVLRVWSMGLLSADLSSGAASAVPPTHGGSRGVSASIFPTRPSPLPSTDWR